VAELVAGLDVDAAVVMTQLLDDLSDAGDAVEAADVVFPSAWPAVAEIAADGGVDADGLVAAIPEEHLRTVFARLQFASPDAIDRFAQAAWDARPGDPRVLAVAVEFAARMALPRALEWSARLRATGLGNHCPLLAVAGDAGRQAPDRVRAAVVAAATFEDAAAVEALADAVAAVELGQLGAVLEEVSVLAPELLDELIVAAATTAPRCVVVAGCLFDHEAVEGALAVLGHGLGLPDLDPDELYETARTHLHPDVAAGLAEVVAAHGEVALAELLSSTTASALDQRGASS
jgi:hypothetical protein